MPASPVMRGDVAIGTARGLGGVYRLGACVCPVRAMPRYSDQWGSSKDGNPLPSAVEMRSDWAVQLAWRLSGALYPRYCPRMHVATTNMPMQLYPMPRALRRVL